MPVLVAGEDRGGKLGVELPPTIAEQLGYFKDEGLGE
jgi:hypothetical protein